MKRPIFIKKNILAAFTDQAVKLKLQSQPNKTFAVKKQSFPGGRNKAAVRNCLMHIFP